jgi:hypothetical protein
MSQKIRYHVGRHVLEIAANKGRWTTTVDGVGLDQWFMSLADAWTAGVTEAGRLDRCATGPAPSLARARRLA